MHGQPLERNWRLTRSVTGSMLDLAALLLALVLVISAGNPWLLLAALVVFMALALPQWLNKSGRVCGLSLLRSRQTGDEWWVFLANGQRRKVRWHRLSLRRGGLLVLYPSLYPWQAVIIRPDNCRSQRDFVELKRALHEVV